MARSFTERKRIRKSFGRIEEVLKLHNLIDLQKRSFENFLQIHIPHEKRQNTGLFEVFSAVFPIKDYSGKSQLEFCRYDFEEPKYDENECRQKGLTFAASLRVQFRLVVWDLDPDTGAKSIKDIKEQDVYIGDIPLMTERGTFIINGIERVVVSQMHRSPGVFFDIDQSRSTASGKPAYLARIVPYRGSWIDFDFDARDILNVRIDRRRKVSLGVFLMSLYSKETEEIIKKGESLKRENTTGMSREEILGTFYETVCYKKKKNGWIATFNPEHWKNVTLNYDLVNADTQEVVVEAGTKLTPRGIKKLEKDGLEKIFLTTENLIGQFIAHEKINEETGEVILSSGEEITETNLEKIRHLKEIHTLYIDNINVTDVIVKTITADNVQNRDEALLEVYKAMRPGEPPTVEGGEILFKSLFFDGERYDLSGVGRAKLNERLGFGDDEADRTLRKKDIIAVLKTLFDLRDSQGAVDDIDNLGNRRVRSVGELIENQFRIGVIRMERTIRERMATGDVNALMPHDLINAKPVAASVREFFGSSQLSQFMDQTNPLSEITHKRRLSALGPGGLSRDRAGFEVRDVHPTHYGRICPIETPEGQNIGLINSLATYARINRHGFIETPYRVVKDGFITKEVIWVSAIQENKHTIAQATIAVDDKGYILDDMLPCRHAGDFAMYARSEITLVDLSPKQMVSVAASLIPFLEKDDASRALMGSNMQRQAVPLIKTEAPLIGTGMEKVIAKDSGAVVLAKRRGEIDQVDGKRIVIRVLDENNRCIDVDIYNLMKFQGSNMNTCLTQKPLVKIGDVVEEGDVIADGPSIEMGELALGRNVLVGFMSWQGYNFEDSVVISEKIGQQDVFTSIHVEEFEMLSRDTKLGNEEITRDIPNANEEALRHLDEAGIVYVGADVKPGDILVGKVTPKGENPMTPEEKLLRAIFGEKASDVKDSSLRVPAGVSGTVVDVQILSRRGVDKDPRAISIERYEIDQLAKNRDAERKILENNFYDRLRERLLGQKVTKAPRDHESGVDVTDEYLSEIKRPYWKEIVIADKNLMREIDIMRRDLDKEILRIKALFENKVEKLQRGDELPPGVLKLVRISIAVKRKLQPGDKMAGRHGNKGVVSRVVPVEDMPYLEDGTPLDIILNPLGLPSRMNLGQILETHLGAAARGLGKQITEAIEAYKNNEKTVEDVRDTLLSVYDKKDDLDEIKKASPEAVLEMARNMMKGVPMASPVFDGASLEDIEAELRRVNYHQSGQVTVYDGRTGDPFDRKITVGYIYMLKLHHLVDDKIHARSIGPYSLVTQQPLGGKAQFGGQRFGEMEVWALEAYGAAYVLQEMLTVKSDDVIGRMKVYESVVRGDDNTEAGTPESFNVLVKELRSLGLSVSFVHNL